MNPDIFARMRSLREIYLPILDISLAIAAGFFCLLFLDSVYLISVEIGNFWFGYPSLFLMTLIAGILGGIIPLIFPKISLGPKLLVGFLCLILGGGFFSIWERPFLVDSIFYLFEIQVGLGIFSFLISFLLFGYREAQKAGLFLGILLGSFWISVAQPGQNLWKLLAGLISILVFFNLVFRGFPQIQNQWIPKHWNQTPDRLDTGVFCSFFILLSLNLVLSVFRMSDLGVLSLSSFLIFLFLGMGVRISRRFEKKFRTRFWIGRILLLFSGFLTGISSTWNFLSLPGFALIGFGLGFFESNLHRQTKDLTKNIIFSQVFLALGLIFSFYSLYFIWIALFSLPFALIPFIKSVKVDSIYNILPIGFVLFVSVFLIKPPDRMSLAIPENQSNYQISSAPFPFLLSNLLEKNSAGEEEYLFVQTPLPVLNRVDLPKPEEIGNKILVLGDPGQNRVLEFYLGYLIQFKIPFYLIVPSDLSLEERRSEFSLPSNRTHSWTKLKWVDFLQFRIYYFLADPPDWNSQLTRDWKFHYVLEKTSDLKSIQEIPDAFKKWEPYVSGDLRLESKKWKSLIHESLLAYCRYYHSEFKFGEVLDCYSNTLNFGPLPDPDQSLAYDSLNFSPPTSGHLDLLLYLREDKEYRVAISKKLYPLYESMGERVQSIGILRELIRESADILSPSELEILESELARMYLRTGNLEESFSWISAGLKKYSNSVVWPRLKEEWDRTRESRRSQWMRPN